MSEIREIPQSDSGIILGVLIRIYYLLLGPGAMVILPMKIYQSGAAFSWMDILFLCNLILMSVAARYDLVWRERTPDEEPAEPKQWRRYVLIMVGVGSVAYLLVRMM